MQFLKKLSPSTAAESDLGHANFTTESGRRRASLDNVKVTNVKTTKRLSYCSEITYCEHSTLSDEFILREDNFGAIENPPELIGFSDCICVFA